MTRGLLEIRLHALNGMLSIVAEKAGILFSIWAIPTEANFTFRSPAVRIGTRRYRCERKPSYPSSSQRWITRRRAA
jgi:hypothetical protein